MLDGLSNISLGQMDRSLGPVRSIYMEPSDVQCPTAVLRSSRNSLERRLLSMLWGETRRDWPHSLLR
jgi:hypothetical protein